MIDIAYYDYDFPSLIKNGVMGGIIGQYISDLFFNVFVYNRRDFLNIISNVSPINSYFAATASGFTNGLTEPYIDELTSVGLRNVVYLYTLNFVGVEIGERDICDTITLPNLVGDTMAVVILVWAFNIHARKDFYNHRAQKNCLPEPYEDVPDSVSSITIILVTNLYAYYKATRFSSNNRTPLSIE